MASTALDGSGKSAFILAVSDGLSDGTFVRLKLGKYRGAAPARQGVVTPLVVRGEPRLRLVTSVAGKDVTSHHATVDGLALITAALGTQYFSATLFTTTGDLTLTFNKRGVAQMVAGRPTFTAAAHPAHDRAKKRAVDPTRPYLRALGITHQSGAGRAEVKPSMYGKFKQISRFIEIIDQLMDEANLSDRGSLAAIDIGAGKGYLTFALYDYLTQVVGRTCAMRGIEQNGDLVKLCNDLAAGQGFSGLAFETSPAEAIPITPVDLLIALHACDTATDDAIHHGVAAGAAVIVCAPCCQHEIAPQMDRAAPALDGLLRFGLLRQRQADLVTDAARALLLEALGYKVKIIEFVSSEHTAKNLLIAAVRSGTVDRREALRQYQTLKETMGFAHHRLETLLAPSLSLGETK